MGAIPASAMRWRARANYTLPHRDIVHYKNLHAAHFPLSFLPSVEMTGFLGSLPHGTRLSTFNWWSTLQCVIPAKAGIQARAARPRAGGDPVSTKLDSRLRGNDGYGGQNGLTECHEGHCQDRVPERWWQAIWEIGGFFFSALKKTNAPISLTRN